MGRGTGEEVGDNINHLVTIITENKVFHFLLRNWMFLSASDVSDTVIVLLFPLSLAIDLSFSLSCLSICLSLLLCLYLSSLYISLSLSLSY